MQTLLPSQQGTSGVPMSLPPTKKRRATLGVSPVLGSASRPLLEGRGSFLSTNYKVKVAMVQEFAKKWGLAPAQGSEGVLNTLEEAQVYFMEVFISSFGY